MTADTFVDRASRRLNDQVDFQAQSLGRSATINVITGPEKALATSPVFINGCFGWFHSCGKQISGNIAVLICPPVSWDALHAHHSLRLLGEACAAAGYPTLRYNYRGTADSDDMPDAGGEQWTDWQSGIHQAIDWLRATTGAAMVVLAGLRLGATLATLVAESRDDIAGLILMAPILRGRSYIRQLAVESQMENGQTANLDEGLDFLELSLSAQTVSHIRSTDLRDITLRPGLKVVVFRQAESRLVETCVKAWLRGGVDVSVVGFHGLEPMLQQTIHGDPPQVDLSSVIQWLRRTVPADRVARDVAVPSNPALQAGQWTETPLQFGPGGRLFGILSQPNGPARGPVVIIVNTGRDPHYGIARFGVELARRLAAGGVPSFRMDFSGLGDSLGPPGQENIIGSLFEADRSGDISAAIDMLEQHGQRQFAIHGLCSGAYHAFHGALADPRIEALLLLNFPVFNWQNVRLLLAPKYYLNRLGEFETWTRMARGQLELGSIIKAQFDRLREKVLDLINQPKIAALQSLPHRAMSTLSRRNVKTLFLFSAGDLGLAALDQAFRRLDGGVSAFEGTVLQIVPEFDHVLTGAQMREKAANLMLDFLAGRLDGATQHNPAPPDAATELKLQ